MPTIRANRTDRSAAHGGRILAAAEIIICRSGLFRRVFSSGMCRIAPAAAPYNAALLAPTPKLLHGGCDARGPSHAEAIGVGTNQLKRAAGSRENRSRADTFSGGLPGVDSPCRPAPARRRCCWRWIKSWPPGKGVIPALLVAVARAAAGPCGECVFRASTNAANGRATRSTSRL